MGRPRYAWTRFSLRSLLALLTLVACWLGYEAHGVRQRKTALAELRRDYSALVVFADAAEQRWGPVNPNPQAPSWLRRLMGDQHVVSISVYVGHEGAAANKRAELVRLFPEANIAEVPQRMEPCHPGCFPAGTLVDTPHGRRAIESIVVGQLVWSITANGERTKWPVREVFRTTNRLWQVMTEAGTLTTTATQPLRLPDGTTCGAGELRPGDEVLWWDGASVKRTRVLRAQATRRIAPVFNLVLDADQTFVAGRFIVRSKPPRAMTNQAASTPATAGPTGR